MSGPITEAYPRAQTFTRKASKWVFQFAALKFMRGEAGVLLRHTNNWITFPPFAEIKNKLNLMRPFGLYLLLCLSLPKLRVFGNLDLRIVITLAVYRRDNYW